MVDASTSRERDKHAILGGKVHLYRRGDSDKWHCSTFLKGINRRKSTKEDSLPLARQIAEAHELAHALYPDHGLNWQGLLTQVMQDWRIRKNDLERQLL